MTPLRLRYGLRWKTSWPPVARPLFALFVVLLLYALAGTLDYHVQKAAELERLKPVAESYSDVVVAAMNGDARFQVGDEMFECKGGKL